ncbi:clua, partial [Symbiodinium sp. KB8]
HFAANLIDLLRAVSPTFASGFKALLEASTSGRIEGRVPCLPSAQDDNMMHPATAPWRGRLLDRNSYPGFRTHGHGTVPAFNGALSSIGSGLAFSTMPWLVPPPDSFGEGHGFDPQRAEDDLTSSYGMDERGTLREWNEELQACFEFPTSTAEERAMRSRGQHKVLVDFVEAAAQGAMAIKHGHVLPLNPGDFHGQRVYVSEGGGGAARAGGDMAAAVKWDVPPEAASVSDSNHDLRMLKVVNACGVPGLHTLATTLVNIGGLRFVAQSIIPGIMQGEHASSLVYGSVTNGITIVSDPEMHGLMRTLCDRLHVAERIVRPLASDMLPEGSEPMHSMKPVPLVGPVECKGIVGSDGRRYLLDLGRLSPPDRHFYIRDDTLRYTLWFDDGSPQSVLQPSDYWPDPPKELASPDTRMRCLPSVLPQNETGYVALYRPELVQAFARHWAEEARKEGQSEPPPLALNVNLITRFQDRCTDPAGEPCAEADGEVLVKLQSFYHDVVLPRTFKELCAAVTHITDGAALTTFLHARGVNMRHMGILHGMAVEGEARGDVPLVVRELLEVEMVARMVRRKLHHFLASTGRDLLPPAYATALFLNAVLGAPDGKGPQHLHKGGIPASPSLPKAWRKSIASFLTEAEAGSPPQFCPPHILGVIDADRQFMRPMLLWSWIRREIESHFKTRLSLFWESGGYSSVLKRPNTDCSFKHWWKYTDDDGTSHPTPPVPSITCFERCHRPALLRRIAQKAGLQLAALPIDWTRANPITLEHIVGLVPVVKHCLPSPISPDAQALMVQARSLMAQRKYEEALAKANDAFGVLYIVVGVAHPDTAQCCSLQALILWHLKDRAGAVACQRQAVTLYEQLLGLDASETIRAHDTLAAVLAGAGMLPQAIHHYHRVLYLLEMVVGPRHPMSVATYVRVGMLAHDARHSNLALQSFSVAQSRCADDAQAAACAHATAMTWSARSNFRKAVEAEKTALRIHQARGEEGAKAAQAAEQWIRKFTEKAVALQKELAAMSAMGSAAAALATALQESATDTAASPSPAPKQDLPAVQALPVSKSQPVARIGTRWKPRRSRKKRNQENTRCATDFRSITMATDAPAAGAPDQAADATSVDIELAPPQALVPLPALRPCQKRVAQRAARETARELALEYATEPYHILPYKWSHYAEDWVQVRTEVRRDRFFAGVTVSFTQLSDSIAFAFIAGVGPLVGLHAAWIVGLATAIFGSRPGMVNGATGVRAAVIAPYVKEFGVGFLFYIILVISVYQFLAGVFGLARFVRMVPRTVMMGFVCGLAVIMAMGQIPQFKECPPLDTLPDGVCTPDDKVFIDDARLGIMITHIVVVVLTIAFGVPALDKLTGVRLPATLIAILLCILIEHGIVRPTGGPGTPTIGE